MLGTVATVPYIYIIEYDSHSGCRGYLVEQLRRFLNLISYISFLFIFLQPLSFQAQMAKLVDALVSGTSVSNDVQVRVLFWALPHPAQMVKLVDTPA